MFRKEACTRSSNFELEAVSRNTSVFVCIRDKMNIKWNTPQLLGTNSIRWPSAKYPNYISWLCENYRLKRSLELGDQHFHFVRYNIHNPITSITHGVCSSCYCSCHRSPLQILKSPAFNHNILPMVHKNHSLTQAEEDYIYWACHIGICVEMSPFESR